MGYREPTAESIVHVYNRGPKKLNIYRVQNDLFRLMRGLYYFNTTQPMPLNWARDVAETASTDAFAWPERWEPRIPLVAVLAFTLMPNHLHLVLKELIGGGTGKFMHRVSMSYSKFINEKYDESGSLFQGPYKARRIDNDADLRNLLVYTMVKNPFELYPGGLAYACKNFDDAYERALAYPFTSLAEYVGEKPRGILDHELLQELGLDSDTFKEFARDTMLNRLDQTDEFDF